MMVIEILSVYIIQIYMYGNRTRVFFVLCNIPGLTMLLLKQQYLTFIQHVPIIYMVINNGKRLRKKYDVRWFQSCRLLLLNMKSKIIEENQY